MDWPENVKRLQRNWIGPSGGPYHLKDWLFSRQRYWGEPFPIVYDEADPDPGTRPIPLPDDMLPVTLPEMTDFRPVPQDEASDPVPALARAPGWAEVTLDLGDGLRRYRRELNVMPQWAGSCWYYLRYTDPFNDTALAEPENERYWMLPAGVDLYVGGVEHAVLHLLYARFWHKVLYDWGVASTPAWRLSARPPLPARRRRALTGIVSVRSHRGWRQGGSWRLIAPAWPPAGRRGWRG